MVLRSVDSKSSMYEEIPRVYVQVGIFDCGAVIISFYSWSLYTSLLILLWLRSQGTR